LYAWSSLGLRRLPYGLALRPTKAFEHITKYPWHGASLDFEFGTTTSNLALEIDGKIVYGTLQIPEKYISEKTSHKIRLISDVKVRPLLLRSHVRLDDVKENESSITYYFTAFGIASLTFSLPIKNAILADDTGHSIPYTWQESNGLNICCFEHFGNASLTVATHY
ncbi:MAG: hypothetical protein QXH80_00720, partial [Candidatus Nanoarchaeia archaeon]